MRVFWGRFGDVFLRLSRCLGMVIVRCCFCVYVFYKCKEKVYLVLIYFKDGEFFRIFSLFCIVSGNVCGMVGRVWGGGVEFLICLCECFLGRDGWFVYLVLFFYLGRRREYVLVGKYWESCLGVLGIFKFFFCILGDWSWGSLRGV